jgi:hypothetical protein
MSNTPGQLSPDEISQLFEKLPPRDVAEFYASYQQWLRQQQIAQLQTRIANVRQQIVANDLQMQQAHPSAIALASLARLQSNGVTDLDILDRMLERGDTWLDNAIQHLEYCEKFDFIRGNYTEWCEHALEGAYDWIDSMRKVSFAANALPQSAVNSLDQSPSLSKATTPTNNTTAEALNEATEETFLQKLMSEEDISHLDIALTLEIISPINPIPADTLIPLEDQDTAQIQATGPHAKQPLVETLDVDAPLMASQHLDTPIVAETPVEHRDSLDPTPVLIAETPVEHRDPLDPTPVLADETPVEHRDPLDPTPVLADETPVEHRDPLDPTPVLADEPPVEHRDPLDPTPVLADEPLTGTIENIADSTLIPVEEISTLTPEKALDSTLVHVEESPAIPAEHIHAAPSAEELHSIEDTSLPESQEDAPAPAQTTSTPSLLEDITQPLIPAQARPKEVSDISTLPEIPTMATPQSQQETGETAASTDPHYTTNDAPWGWEAPLPSETSPPSSQPTTRESAQQTTQPPLPVAQPPKKRNFLQRLFSRR